MKIIETLSDKINEELDDARSYAKLAIDEKSEHRGLAEALMSLSNDEMRHSMVLHNEVAKLIEEYRKANGEPPAEMMAVYKYLHGKSIEKAERVKRLQQMYNG